MIWNGVKSKKKTRMRRDDMNLLQSTSIAMVAMKHDLFEVRKELLEGRKIEEKYSHIY